MYGVILWSDLVKKCAVIWCEDHRSLAYFSCAADDRQNMTMFGPGDLVEFDVKEEGDMRIALRPSLVAQGQYESLNHDLIQASKPKTSGHASCANVAYKPHGGARIVAFREAIGRGAYGANSRSVARGLKAS